MEEEKQNRYEQSRSLGSAVNNANTIVTVIHSILFFHIIHFILFLHLRRLC